MTDTAMTGTARIDLDQARGIFVAGLRNAHAMEKQALAIMQPQVNRLTHYPELSQRLEAHIVETESQIDRLDGILNGLDESNSAIKDTLLTAFGTMAALGHVPAGDEVLKNSFANLAFENYEIAAYTSLLEMARLSGHLKAASLLQQSLEEERRMAQWVADQIPAMTEKFLTLQSLGETAKR